MPKRTPLETVYKRIGKRIKLARLEAQMSQVELARRIGFTNHSMVSAIEAGKQPIYAHTLLRIAVVLKKTVNWITQSP